MWGMRRLKESIAFALFLLFLGAVTGAAGYFVANRYSSAAAAARAAKKLRVTICDHGTEIWDIAMSPCVHKELTKDMHLGRAIKRCEKRAKVFRRCRHGSN